MVTWWDRLKKALWKRQAERVYVKASCQRCGKIVAHTKRGAAWKHVCRRDAA